MKVDVQEGVNSDFLVLAGNEFLKKKNRPGTLTEHFPFLTQCEGCCNILLKNEVEEIVGGMVLKFSATLDGYFGSIGLVVVHEEYRGKNYSSLMMKQAIETAKEKELQYLVLWTSLHNYYYQFGFIIDEPLVYLELDETCYARNIIDEEILTFSSRPTYTHRLGQKRLGDTTVVYIYDGSGYIFTGYSGNIDSAAKIITNKYGNPNRPRVNIEKNDPLINKLITLQPNLSLFQNQFEMWLKIQPAVEHKTVIDFLNRI